MSQPVYDQIGGREAVEAVVEDFYDGVLADEDLVPYFEGQDMQALYAHQVQFISAVAGGPVEYTGADMREAHAHLNISEEDFATVAAYLEQALLENGVDQENADEILAEVAALEPEIVA